MQKTRKLIQHIQAALGSCPKCGYGFAGKKPTPKGMVKLDPTDPKYDPTKPCPNCEMGMNEDPSSSPSEKYYVYSDSDDLGYVGPFYEKSDAEDMKQELTEYIEEIDKWMPLPQFAEVSGHSVVTERQMHNSNKDRATRLLDQAKENGIDDPDVLKSWGDTTPHVTSPAKARSAHKQVIDFAKKQHYEKQTPKGPNVAFTRLTIRNAQLTLGPNNLELVMSDDKDILPLLQKALIAEFQQWDLYYAYKALLTGLSRDPIAEHFAEHASDEADHIEILQRFIVGMGARPTIQRSPIPELENLDMKQIVALQLKFEQDAIGTYQEILGVLDDRSGSALKIEIENILIKETEHAHDLQLLLRE